MGYDLNKGVFMDNIYKEFFDKAGNVLQRYKDMIDKNGKYETRDLVFTSYALNTILLMWDVTRAAEGHINTDPEKDGL